MNSRMLFKYLIILSILLGLGGCTSLNRHLARFERAQDSVYLKSTSGKQLSIPADLSGAQIHEQYPIPPIPSQGPVHTPDLVPPHSLSRQLIKHSSAHQQTKQVQLVKNEQGKPVLFVAAKPQAVWTQLNSAFQVAGYRIVKQIPKANSYLFIAKENKKQAVYQLHVANTGAYSELSVLRVNNQPASAKLSQAVLQSFAYYFREKYHEKA